MKLKQIARTAIPSLLLSFFISQSSYAQCLYMGGYPWKDGGCLIAKDLNAAIAGRNPLLDYPARSGETIVGFDGGVPIYGSFGSVSIPFPTADTLGGVKAYTAPNGQFLTGLTTLGVFTSAAPVAVPPAPPTPSVLGGVHSYAAPAKSFLTGVTTTGDYTIAAPTLSDITGGAIAVNPGSAFVGIGTPLPGALLHLAGTISTPAWGSSGILIRQDAMTVNDTTGSGTIEFTYLNAIAGPILANVNAATYTNVATLFVGPPGNPGGLATITNKWSLLATGNARFDGPFYLKSIVGQTQCLQADSLGLVSGIPQPCGSITREVGWVPNVDPDLAVFYTAWRAGTVVDIRGRVQVPVGATAQATVYKAASGIPCTPGNATAQHSTPFMANGTANANQTITLVGGAANQIAAGETLCLGTTGTWLGGVGKGGITVTIQ